MRHFSAIELKYVSQRSQGYDPWVSGNLNSRPKNVQLIVAGTKGNSIGWTQAYESKKQPT